MNFKNIIDFLYKIFNVNEDWDGKKKIMNEKSGFFSYTENRYYKVDCNTNARHYFYCIHREKSGPIQVEIYKSDFERYSCPSTNSSSSSSWSGGMFDSDVYRLEERYHFTVEITEESIKFIDVGIFSSSEITSPMKIDECKKIFMKGLQEYGMPVETSGGRQRKSSKRKLNKRKSIKRD